MYTAKNKWSFMRQPNTTVFMVPLSFAILNHAQFDLSQLAADLPEWHHKVVQSMVRNGNSISKCNNKLSPLQLCEFCMFITLVYERLYELYLHR